MDLVTAENGEERENAKRAGRNPFFWREIFDRKASLPHH